MPVERVCEKLKKKDSQICELKYGKFRFLSHFLHNTAYKVTYQKDRVSHERKCKASVMLLIRDEVVIILQGAPKCFIPYTET